MWHCIADAIDQGGVEFDYLRGNEPYKYLWSGQSRQTCTLVCMPLKSFRLRSYYYLSESKKVLKARVKSIIMDRKKRHPK
jgi:CelD/BcsL family acetyltransferase involved in cellulose biosynthesis